MPVTLRSKTPSISRPEGHLIPSFMDTIVVRRLLDELYHVAFFVGPDFGHVEAVRYANRIWPRYFGHSSIPANFLSQLYESLKKIADGESKEFLPRPENQLFYPLGDALYELVALAMFRRWYYWRESCPVPFDCPDLVDIERMPICDQVYKARRQGRGNFINFSTLLSDQFLILSLLLIGLGLSSCYRLVVQIPYTFLLFNLRLRWPLVGSSR